LAVTLSVAASLYLFLPSGFAASAEVLLPMAAAPTTTDPNIRAPLATDTFIDGQIKLLESDRVLQKVIDRFRLWQDPELAERSSPLGRLLASNDPVSSGVLSEGRDRDRSARIAAFRQRLDVASLMPTPAIRVSYRSADSYRAAAVATAVAEAYIETVAAEARKDEQQAESDLAQRLARLHARVAAAPAGIEQSAQLPTQLNDPNSRRRQVEAAISASMYGSALAQYADVARASKPTSSEPRIVREAVPSRGNSTSWLGVLAFALGVGSLIGLGSAIRREAISRPVRSASDLNASLGVPTLGRVPLVLGRKLLPKRTRARPLLLHDDQDHLRALLLRLRRDANGSGALVLGVASAVPGEGKSTIAFNLAVLAAENGERVLLADMDLHNCTLTSALTEGDEGRLVDAIDGRYELPDAITRTEQRFDVLGQRSLDDDVRPVSLLASQRMDALLAHARSLYDIVICDLPSLLDHADVSAISDSLDRFVLVAEWGRTPVSALEQASQQLSVMESRLVGAVLNKVPPRS